MRRRLDNIPALSRGSHHSIDEGACLLEAVSWVSGEPWSDHPSCASPILGAFGRTLNDILPDGKRQHLMPLVPLIVGTAGDGHDQERGLMAVDWIIRVYAPTWLRFGGLEEAAVTLESLPRQASWDDVEAAVPVVRGAWSEAVAAVGAPASIAAEIAAGDVAWVVARDATGDAGGDAAWDAARAAAGAAGWDTARVAAADAAGDAAVAAARVALRDAHRDEAEAALRPTVDLLQDSAIALFTRMVVVEHLPE